MDKTTSQMIFSMKSPPTILQWAGEEIPYKRGYLAVINFPAIAWLEWLYKRAYRSQVEQYFFNQLLDNSESLVLIWCKFDRAIKESVRAISSLKLYKIIFVFAWLIQQPYGFRFFSRCQFTKYKCESTEVYNFWDTLRLAMGQKHLWRLINEGPRRPT